MLRICEQHAYDIDRCDHTCYVLTSVCLTSSFLDTHRMYIRTCLFRAADRTYGPLVHNRKTVFHRFVWCRSLVMNINLLLPLRYRAFYSLSMNDCVLSIAMKLTVFGGSGLIDTVHLANANCWSRKLDQRAGDSLSP